MTGTIKIQGHSAGLYSGMVGETIMAEFPQIQGETILAAIALRPTLPIRRDIEPLLVLSTPGRLAERSA